MQQMTSVNTRILNRISFKAIYRRASQIRCVSVTKTAESKRYKKTPIFGQPGMRTVRKYGLLNLFQVRIHLQRKTNKTCHTVEMWMVFFIDSLLKKIKQKAKQAIRNSYSKTQLHIFRFMGTDMISQQQHRCGLSFITCLNFTSLSIENSFMIVLIKI